PRVQSYTLPIWPGSVLTTKHFTYTPRILTSSKLSATFAYVSYFVLGGQLVQDVQQQPSSNWSYIAFSTSRAIPTGGSCGTPCVPISRPP
ncbi:unnamed protein product, partial [Pylaiella littoralis]